MAAAPSRRQLAVGHFLNAPFPAACAPYLDRIREVFFAWPGVLSCRPAEADTPENRERRIADLVWARSAGLELDALFNCNCYGDAAISPELEDLVVRTLRELDRAGLFPETVTTTSPFVAHLLRRRFPGVQVRFSINLRVHGSTGLEAVLGEFDSFYASRERHRERDWLAALADWAHQRGKRLGIQANSGCLRQCPYQTFHDNLHGHGDLRQAAIGERDYGFSYFLCRRTLAQSEAAEMFLRATWFRPEDLDPYADLVDFVKLSTRRHPDPAAVIKAYATGRYEGDLARLLDPVHALPRPIDNAALARAPDWPAVFACSHANDCRHCGKCAAVLRGL